ncbi:MAG: helix-hairpin-helix domain-containing protein [Sulfurimonadaceae bacterium]|nr:helix-hairpin-helix domain-containing protein [Sulfurimonadaceae bacterium]
MGARHNVHSLTEIPNIGKALARTFELGGIAKPSDFIGQDPYELFDSLCDNLGERLDPCVLDAIISAVHYMNGGTGKKWWEFTQERKTHCAKED